MDATCPPGALDNGACVLRAVRKWLFGQQMAMMRERGERHRASRGGYYDVEHHPRLGLVENGIEVRADRDAIELVFARPRFRPVGIEIDEADDGYLGNLSGGVEPSFAHGSATDQDDIYHPSSPPARPLQAGFHSFRKRFFRKRLREHTRRRRMSIGFFSSGHFRAAVCAGANDAFDVRG